MFYFPHSKNLKTFNIHPVYIPTFYSIALNSKSSKPLSFVVGKVNSFEIKRAYESYENVLHLKNTATNFEFIPGIEQSNNLKVFLQNQLNEAGNYILKTNDQIVDAVSFNYDKSESRLSYYTPNELKDIADENNIRKLEFLENNSNTIDYNLSRINQGIQLWYYLILFALIFVILEILLIKFLK